MNEYRSARAAAALPALDELFRGRLTAKTAPASVYAIVVAGEIVAWGSQADPGVLAAPTADTAFRIASCTKSFTAATLLSLRDEGLVDLDAPVDEYVEARFVPRHGESDRAPVPTVGMLARMAGGLPTDDPWGDRQESLTADEFDALTRGGLRLVDAPGARYEYSNLGYALVGRVIEKVTGRRYVDVVTARFLRPLGLAGIGYDPSVRADAVVPGFRRVDDAWVELPFSGPGAFSPIGGVFATPRALARWTGWLASAFDATGAAEAAGSPLSPASRRELQTARTPMTGPGGPGSAGYGYGLVVEEDPRHGLVVSHSGGYPGFGAHMRWHPQSGIGVIAFENATYSRVSAAATAALATVLDDVVEPDAAPAVWPETLAAREAVEALLRRWDEGRADALFAMNVALDDALPRRAARLTALAAQIGLAADRAVPPLREASPRSDSAAHLTWVVPGETGMLRCTIRLTPENPPRLQTLDVRLA